MNTSFFLLMRSELSIILVLMAVLFFKVFDIIKDKGLLIHVTNALVLIGLCLGVVHPMYGSLFGNQFLTTKLIVAEKLILGVGMLIVLLQSFDWLKGHKHLHEFYILLLTTLLGMYYMVSSGTFLMFYLGLELASIPLAALVNFDLHKLKSSEAAVKMILSSAFSSGILLFGISLLYGCTGTINFSELAVLSLNTPLELLALVLIFSGFAFKLSAVPFHFWTADVYEGAPVAVTSFLSVVSKSAIVFVFLSVLCPLFHLFQSTWEQLITITIILTITIGNLFAMRQENIKRFLAFSSISQAGFVLFGLLEGKEMGSTAVIFFLLIYMFSNLGALGVVSLVSEQFNKESLDDYKGFYKTNPTLSWILALSLFSLAGIPPTAGFFGKLFLVSAGASKGNYFLIGIAVLNMVLALYYYLRVIKAIFMDENAEPVPLLKRSFPVLIGLGVCFLGIIITGFASGIYASIHALLMP